VAQGAARRYLASTNYKRPWPPHQHQPEKRSEAGNQATPGPTSKKLMSATSIDEQTMGRPLQKQKMIRSRTKRRVRDFFSGWIFFFSPVVFVVVLKRLSVRGAQKHDYKIIIIFAFYGVVRLSFCPLAPIGFFYCGF
jgi:hypothetical protein